MKDDANKMLVDAIKALGGSYRFIDENDESEIDDLSELGLPLVDAYTYQQGEQGSFYVTSIVLGKFGLAFYGVDELNYWDITETIRIDNISLAGILDILESLPEINKQ